MKKAISLFLSLIMLISAVSISGMTAFASTYGKCGDNARYYYSYYDHTLTISGTGATYEVMPESDAFMFQDWIYDCKAIVVEEGITTIGKDMFYMLNNVTTAKLPSTLKTIDDSAFFYTSIKSIKLNNGLEKIGDYAFCGCRQLTSITIPSTVKSMGSGVFNASGVLKSINVNSSNKYFSSKDGVLFNKSKTKLIRFPIGKKVTSYTVPSTVTTIGDSAFSSEVGVDHYEVKGFGKTLKTVTLPSGIKKIGESAFCGCEVLTSINLHNATSVGKFAFSCCKSLSKLVLSPKMTKIPTNMAFDCPKLKSIFIPSSVTYISNDGLGNYIAKDYSQKKVTGFKIYCLKSNKTAISYAKKYKLAYTTVSSPPKTTLKSVSPVTKGFKATWTKNTTSKITGYQVQFSTDKGFKKNVRTTTVSNKKTASKTVSTLKSGTRYYVRVRTYKSYAGYKVVSAWSGAKSVKAK